MYAFSYILYIIILVVSTWVVGPSLYLVSLTKSSGNTRGGRRVSIVDRTEGSRLGSLSGIRDRSKHE